MKSKLLFRISIPASLTIDYTILQTISVRREQAVLKIRHNKSEETFALKIRFSDLPTFELCPSMNDNLSNLLLPLHIVQDSVFTYEIYPFLESLSDYIRSNKPIDVSFLFQLICHIENSITTMHKSGYAHYDISARNIFLSHENNENVSNSILFYLGDFSCIKSISSKEQQKDINDFSKLFLLLLNHGNFPDLCNAKNTFFPNTIRLLLKQLETSHDTNSVHFFRKLQQTFLSEQPDEKSSCYNFYDGNFSTKFCSETTLPVLQNTKTTVSKNNQRILLLPVIFSVTLFLIALFSYLFKIQLFPAFHTNPAISHAETFTTPPSAPPLLTKNSSPEPYTTPLPVPFSPSPTPAIDTKNSTDDIQILFANNSQVCSLTPYLSYQNLRELYLDNNSISDLKPITKFKKLHTLGISNNCIIDVSPVTSLPCLSLLDLSGNQTLKNIEILVNCNTLKYLIITDTNIPKKQIQRLEKAMPHCTIFY